MNQQCRPLTDTVIKGLIYCEMSLNAILSIRMVNLLMLSSYGIRENRVPPMTEKKDKKKNNYILEQ